eukprot:COSAG01_NODE_2037_length_8579_cov_119.860849_9_plen_217_part_00
MGKSQPKRPPQRTQRPQSQQNAPPNAFLTVEKRPPYLLLHVRREESPRHNLHAVRCDRVRPAVREVCPRLEQQRAVGREALHEGFQVQACVRFLLAPVLNLLERPQSCAQLLERRVLVTSGVVEAVTNGDRLALDLMARIRGAEVVGDGELLPEARAVLGDRVVERQRARVDLCGGGMLHRPLIDSRRSDGAGQRAEGRGANAMPAEESRPSRRLW